MAPNSSRRQSLDSSHAVLVALKLAADGFQVYRCDRPVSLGINLKSFFTVLKVSAGSDSVKMTAEDDGTPDVVDLKFEDAKRAQTACFRLKLMDIDCEHFGIPEDTTYRAVVRIPCGEYKRLVSDLGAIGDTIGIDAKDACVTFSVEGDVGNGAITFRHTAGADGTKAVAVDVQSPIKLTCSGKFLGHFAKACPIAESVTMCLGDNNTPIVFEFKLPEEAGSIRYFLAPKVDNNDDE